jgi:hypothetical protein
MVMYKEEEHAVTWLMHDATGWKVVGLIPNEVIEFFN